MKCSCSALQFKSECEFSNSVNFYVTLYDLTNQQQNLDCILLYAFHRPSIHSTIFRTRYTYKQAYTCTYSPVHTFFIAVFPFTEQISAYNA